MLEKLWKQNSWAGDTRLRCPRLIHHPGSGSALRLFPSQGINNVKMRGNLQLTRTAPKKRSSLPAVLRDFRKAATIQMALEFVGHFKLNLGFFDEKVPRSRVAWENSLAGAWEAGKWNCGILSEAKWALWCAMAAGMLLTSRAAITQKVQKWLLKMCLLSSTAQTLG